MIDLFRHNFDAAPPQEPPLSPEARAEKEEREAEARARQQGFDAGRDLGRREALEEFETKAAERLEQDRAALRAQLAELMAGEAARAELAERDMVELFLGIGERLFPDLLARYGQGLALEQVRQALRQGRSAPSLRVTARPELINALQAALPDWFGSAAEAATIALSAEPEMAPEAVAVSWEGGRLAYDPQEAAAAILEALRTAARDYETPSSTDTEEQQDA
jgi:flagellar biosynthesis/type III secretory pathway protein FliH